MARIRSIKPDYFTDAELADLTPLHRLLFPALWCHADRDGRLEDKPRELKVKCLPFDDCDINGLLEDLHRGGFIIRYEVDGRRLIAIPGFTEHQRFHRDEKSRRLPAPPQHGASTVPAPPLHPAGTTDTQPEHECHTTTARVAPLSDSSTQYVSAAAQDPVRAAGALVSESVNRGAVPGRRAGDQPGGGVEETLRETLERIWLEETGSAYVWQHQDDGATRELLAKHSQEEIERAWRFAATCRFPRCIGVVSLNSKHWNAFASGAAAQKKTKPEATAAPLKHLG